MGRKRANLSEISANANEKRYRVLVHNILESVGIDPGAVPRRLLQCLDSAVCLDRDGRDRRWARTIREYVLDQLNRNAYVEFGNTVPKVYADPSIENFSSWHEQYLVRNGYFEATNFNKEGYQ